MKKNISQVDINLDKGIKPPSSSRPWYSKNDAANLKSIIDNMISRKKKNGNDMDDKDENDFTVRQSDDYVDDPDPPEPENGSVSDSSIFVSGRSRKFLVVSAATDNYSYEYKLTNVLKKAYCEKYGISFVFEDLGKRTEDRPPHYQKIDIVLKYLKKYDYVMWMDVDAWFNDFDIDIMDLVKKYMGSASFLVARDHYCFADPKKWGHSYLNSGVFIVRNNKAGRNILLKWKNPSADAIRYKNEYTKLNDQPYLCNLYFFDKESRENIAVVNPFILNFFPCNGTADIRNREAGMGLNWGWYGAFIVHAAGLAKPYRTLFKGLVHYSANQNGLTLDTDVPILDCAERKIFDNRKSKILIISSGTSNIDYEYNETNVIKRKYCEIYGYDFAFYNIKCKKEDLYFNKIELCRRNMNDYDYIMWIDADAWFNDFTINLYDLIKKIENGKSLLVERGYTTTDKPNKWGDCYINAGIFIIKCDAAGKEIIKQWMENSSISATFEFTKTISVLGDQPVLCNMLLFNDFVKEHSNVLDSLTLSSYLVRKDTDWHNLNTIKFNDDWKKAFIIHAAGVASRNKLRPMFDQALKYTKDMVPTKNIVQKILDDGFML